MRTITEMSGLGASAPWGEQRTTEPVPDRLNSQRVLTLRRLDKFEQVVSPMLKISNYAANIALDRPANSSYDGVSRGGYAPVYGRCGVRVKRPYWGMRGEAEPERIRPRLGALSLGIPPRMRASK